MEILLHMITIIQEKLVTISSFKEGHWLQKTYLNQQESRFVSAAALL